MTLKLTDGGGLLALDVFFGASAKPTDWTIELFTDANPLADDDQGAGRELATGGGYAEIDLDPLVNAAAAAGGIPQVTWDDAVWTFTGPLTNAVNKTIKGYLIMADTTVVFEELLPTPFTPANNGDKLTISLQFKLGNGTPT
jgi:hypothetical protein